MVHYRMHELNSQTSPTKKKEKNCHLRCIFQVHKKPLKQT